MKTTSYLNLNFDHGSLLDRVDRAGAAGVSGIECYGWDLGLEGEQSAPDTFQGANGDLLELAAKIESHDMEWIYLSGNRPPLTDPTQADRAIESIERSLRLADDLGIRYVNVKAGSTQSTFTHQRQLNQVIETLQTVAPIAEAANASLLLEPLNPIEDPGQFIHTAADGLSIIRVVDSPGVGLLLDFYHEQLSAGNLINTVRDVDWDRIPHIHIADPPNRTQPGTGEVNWDSVLQALVEEGYTGYLGGEFRPAGDPVDALASFVRLGERY